MGLRITPLRAISVAMGVAAAVSAARPVGAQPRLQSTVESPASVSRAPWSVVEAGADLAMQALTHLGVPFRFGGQDPQRGFDCSGLVRHVAQVALGIDLPRTAEAMARIGQTVAREALQAGDLVFFNTRGRRYSHVGIYIGEGRFVHAPTRRGLVRVEAVDGRYWQTRFNGARRLASLAPAESPAASLPAGEAAPPEPTVPTGGAADDREPGA
ncbi:MAG: C40 family peptidase [Burkholderiaceae bacterium]|nr:C40 family peptidase [Burkholderiaceae bacterium]